MRRSDHNEGRNRNHGQGNIPPQRRNQPSNSNNYSKNTSYSKKPNRSPKRKPVISKRTLKKNLYSKPKSQGSRNSISYMVSAFLRHVLKYTFILFLLISFLFAGLGGGLLYGYMATAHDLTLQDIRSKNEPTHIYDDQGNEIAVLTGASNINREFVSINIVKPTYIDDAFMAIEDERFESHIGIDFRRIGSAVFSAIANAGSPKHGGSTITQQTVKLITGNDQISTQRKVQEWYNAVRLEQIKSKDEIMELYVNLVPMGNSYVGVQAAANAYFDKDISDLNIAECAFLAGIPNRPSTYNPLTENGRRNSLRRMRIVLEKMFELERISKEEYLDALNTELIFRQTPQKVKSNQVNSYFVDYVIEQVINDLITQRGYKRDFAIYTLYNSGLQIYTTLNQDIQNKVDEIYENQANFVKSPGNLPDIPEKPQSAMTIISNTSPGQVKAIAGGVGKKNANLILNRATAGYRSPGSSIKPVLVYAPALETGLISAASIYIDEPKYLDKQNPNRMWPKNASGSFSGSMSVRQAVYHSANTIAAEVFSQLTPDVGLEYLAHSGIDRRDEPYLATSLGAFTHGATTYEMAGAFATLANQGLYTEPHVYTEVINLNGASILAKKPKIEQVYRPETSFIMTDILKDVLTQGTGRRAALKNYPAAGKTGTSEKDVDKWFCGYTTQYTAAVWYGFDNRNGRQTSIPASEFSNAQLIWKTAMDAIHENLEPQDFTMPAGVKKATVCVESGQKAGPYCPETKTDYFINDYFKDTLCEIHLEPLVTELSPDDLIGPDGLPLSPDGPHETPEIPEVIPEQTAAPTENP